MNHVPHLATRLRHILWALTLIVIVCACSQRITTLDGPPPASLKEVGAQFESDRAEVVPARIDADISLEAAHRAALDYFTEGWGITAGFDIVERNVTYRDTTGLFSGTTSESGSAPPWDIFDREVRVVVLHDIPASLPCSLGGCSPPHMAFAIDAETGEVLRSTLLGGGASTWPEEDLDALKAANETARRGSESPTPTPTPTSTPTPSPGN